MTKTSREIFSYLLLYVFTSCCGQTIQEGNVSTDLYVPLLQNKKVAIVANQTSTIYGVHLLDTLLDLGVDVIQVFSPEHGFRGKAVYGENINDEKDAKTGINIISLYGKKRKPSSSDLAGVGVVLFDIADVGVRFYTYISTLHYVMEACAENQVELIVLDRPNPNGDYVAGPVLKSEVSSFVGMHSIPVVHGLTVGELALMINGQRWLNDSLQCLLKVIPCKGYDHRMKYVLKTAPSPNLPNYASIRLYPSLCLFEATTISIGRGTDKPFQTIGHPSLQNEEYCFVPESVPAAPNPKHKGLVCCGEDLSELGAFPKFTLKYFIKYYEKLSSKEVFVDRPEFFNLLIGDTTILGKILNHESCQEIEESWKSDLEKYKQMRKQYLLYPDFE